MPKPVCPTWRPPFPRPAGAQTAEKQHAGLLQAGRATKARLTPLAVTHRYNRTHCLWLEQFQIADYALALSAGLASLERTHIALYGAPIAALRARAHCGRGDPARNDRSWRSRSRACVLPAERTFADCCTGESGFELARRLAAPHQDGGPAVTRSDLLGGRFRASYRQSPATGSCRATAVGGCDPPDRRWPRASGPARRSRALTLAVPPGRRRLWVPPGSAGTATGSAGSRTCSAVPRPAGLSTQIVPPRASTRSLRPIMPEPRLGSAPPTPSSLTERIRAPSQPSARISMTEACACFATFASASDAM